ncbi:MAG: hypothetical protein B5M52_04960 [Helicobacteraceae bacterium 4484_230]|nr:MAG: hypothetical protein B5M52_04960 [Helicobacteraceae bacterium 4484_230]
MRVLLLNDNPVIDKLVTLSAKKRGDELLKASDKDAMESGEYSLLIVDESSVSAYIPEEIAEHISYGYTLFTATRGTAVPDIYDNVLYKPFLPMELLGEFEKAKNAAAVQESHEVCSDENSAASQEEPLDEGESEWPSQNVLNETEVQEVQGILDDFEDEKNEEEPEIDEEDNGVTGSTAEEEPLQEDDDIWGDGVFSEDDDVQEAGSEAENENTISLEEQIGKAIETLSKEDLMHEIDEKILFDIAREAKILEESEWTGDAAEEDESVDDLYADLVNASRYENSPRAKAMGALETLLGMLSDEEVAASLKAMNISINISFGDKK